MPFVTQDLFVLKLPHCERFACRYEHDATVIYGDTDSVMVKFGTKDMAETMRLGKEAAEYVTTEFEKPIQLEFEKVSGSLLGCQCGCTRVLCADAVLILVFRFITPSC